MSRSTRDGDFRRLTGTANFDAPVGQQWPNSQAKRLRRLVSFFRGADRQASGVTIQRISADRTFQSNLQNGFGSAFCKSDLKSQIAIINVDDNVANVPGWQCTPPAAFGELDCFNADVDDLANRVQTEDIKSKIEGRFRSRRTKRQLHGRLVLIEKRQQTKIQNCSRQQQSDQQGNAPTHCEQRTGFAVA